jgi:DivIVA domain-containing protein
MRRKKQEQDAVAPGRVTPADVQQVEFRLAFRGYNERDVDAFLDRITEDLSAYLEENQRLRSGAALPATPPVGEGEAEEILARARDEAAAIIRRAEQDSAAIRAAAGSAGPGPTDTRAAVAPFLNREREFLQSLGTLVQGHAEEIKQMVVALRARAEAAVPEAQAAGPAPALATAPDAPQDRPETQDRPAPAPPAEEGAEAFAPASGAEIADRLGMSEPASSTEDEGAEEVGTVVIESSTEPAYSSEGAPAGERRERSLRELFWGEE